MVRVRIWREQFVGRLYMSQCVRNNSANLAPTNMSHDQSSVAWPYELTQATTNCLNSHRNSAEQTVQFRLEDEQGNEPCDSSGFPAQRNAFGMESTFVTVNRCTTSTSNSIVKDREFRAPLGDNQMHRRNGDALSRFRCKSPTKSEGTYTILSGINIARTPRVRYIEEKDNCCSTILAEKLRAIQTPTNLDRSTLGCLPNGRPVTISRQYSSETRSSWENQEVSVYPTPRIPAASDLELLEIRNHSVTTTNSRISAPETFCLELVTFLLTKFHCGQTTGASTCSARLERRQKCVLRIRLLHSCLIFILILIATIILPSIIFHHTEKGWSFLDAIYFCVISMTLVGLGDLVPSGYETIEESRTPTVLYLKRIFNVLTTIYLLFGTTMILFGVRVIEDSICSERNAVSNQSLLVGDPAIRMYNSDTAFESGQSNVTSAPTNFIRRGRSNTDVSIIKKKPQAEPPPEEKRGNNSQHS
ncbi:unnamed protein product [Dicrocoelium dendriticum]|nr:unnamed protein product [Dicrocoelium dendriticum]